MTNTESRRTRQRTAIWEYLTICEEFQTAQQIHEGLRRREVLVSLPTVYRTLAAMAQAKEIDMVMAQAQATYRKCSTHHHHHLTCRSCGNTIELLDGPIETWAASLAQTYGYAEVTHITEITGVCPRCQIH